MAICTTNDVFNDVRGLLNDNQVVGGEVFTNTFLQVQFNEPYRTMFGSLMGASKRVERVAYVLLPVNTTVLIPSTAGLTDFAEPEMIEERPATNATAISTTSNTTPITVTTVAPHGFGPNGTQVMGFVTGVIGSNAPWGNWGAVVTGPSTFTLNGSAGDGSTGTSGAFYGASQVQWQEVMPADLTNILDGQPQQYLLNYVWMNEQLLFRGSTQNQMLRLTYYASGTPPASVNININIDNCRDFLACATAYNAAQAVGWNNQADRFGLRAYSKTAGPQGEFDGGLLGVFRNIQVMAMQRGPSRRHGAFRDKRTRFGGYLLS
jgi:hypothetical protein